MRKNIFTVFFALTVVFSYAQTGKHGNVIVTTANQIVNEYTILTSDVIAGATTITVTSNNLNANNRFPGPLETGDLLMIIQMQGVSLNAFPDPWDPTFGMPYDDSWGDILNYNNCGNYEFAEVHSVGGTSLINLSCGLQHSYTASGKVQVIRIPRYLILTVNQNASVTCENWNGQTGGVVCTEVSDNLLIQNNASIHANSGGFRGGLALLNTAGHGGGQYSNTNPAEGGEKGEGIYGYQLEYNSLGGGMYARGAAGNAGGGGNIHNAGGGGGGNAGNISAYTGHGNPDISVTNWITAWNLESPGFANHTSSGGGRGGYTYSLHNQNAITAGPGNTTWGGDFRRQVGGLGGRPLDYSTGKIFMGGGGGAGHMNDEDGGSGGNGGGIVYIISYGGVSGSGTISSNGQNGYDAVGPAPPVLSSQISGHDGAGGGGAGGTLIIQTEGTVTGLTLTANGGNGGNQNLQKGIFLNNDEAEGPGGGGSGGYIAISAGNPVRQTLGAPGGVTNSSGMTEFIPNGATAGGAGINNAVISQTLLNVNTPVTVCYGDDVTVSASLSGSILPGTQITWWNNQTGGLPIHTGTSYSITNILQTDTLWVGFCPGWFRKPLIIQVFGQPCNASPDTTICLGDVVQLNAVGGTNYIWSPATGLNNPNISNPLASPATTTTYFVTASEGACLSTDSLTIEVSSVIATISPDTSICAGESVQIFAGGGDAYQWSNASSLSSAFVADPVATPAGTTTYTVTVSNSLNCQITQSVTVTVHNNPLPDLGNATVICEGDNHILNAGSGYISYNWSTSETSQTITISSAGDYSVTVTDINACSGSASISISTQPWADATISPAGPFCSNEAPFNLIAAETGGIWTGTGITNATQGTFAPETAGEGTHSVSYSISGDCPDSDTIQIIVFDIPSLIIQIEPESCLNAADGALTSDISGGTPPYSYQWSNGSSEQNLNELPPGLYHVTVTDFNLCSISSPAQVPFSTEPCFEPHIFVPNIFSPNRDGENDILYVRGDGIEAISFIIYNRWGQKVFETKDQDKGWDGQFKGIPAERGVYTYALKVRFIGSAAWDEFSGTITLVY
jgi:gliding motility-associated-like protein